KQDELMMGDINKKITSPVALPDKKPALVDKSGTGATKAFRFDPAASKTDVIGAESKVPLASGGPAAEPSTNGAEKLVNKTYRVAAGDLPFQVARAKDGDMLVGGAGSDAPVISVGKKTDRGVRTVSSDFVPGGTGGGGTGTGSGSGSGNGL